MIRKEETKEGRQRINSVKSIPDEFKARYNIFNHQVPWSQLIREFGAQAVELQPNEVYQGDCIEHLNKLAPGSVDLVFADPPFNIGYQYDVYDDSRSQGDYLEWCKRWMSGVHRCLKDSGTFWLAIGDEFAAELKVAAQHEIGFHCRSWVIWYYTFGVNCRKGLSRSHTHLFHFVKDEKAFTFNSENPTVRVPSARQLVYQDARANPEGRLPDNTWILRPQDVDQGFTPTQDTWYFARVAGTFKEREGFHGCQMPEQLLGRVIRISSNPGDLVLDPFSGSGTTLSVAKKLDRQWLGFELSDDYVTRIRERLKSIRVGEELSGPADPLKSAPTTKKGKRSKLQLRNGKPIPYSDDEMDKGIIQAFEATRDAQSADHLLCRPELNAAFLKECRQLGLKGSDFVFNRVMLRLRKSGRLPKAITRQKQFSFQKSESFRFASEIALSSLEVDQKLNFDDALCSPQAMKTFDRIAEEFAPGFLPEDYRWAALSIRKRSRQAKRTALESCVAWLTNVLPASIPSDQFDVENCPKRGIYILEANNQTLYVGTSDDLSSRIQQILGNLAWTRRNLSSIRVIPIEESSQARMIEGIQAMLISRLEPAMNSRLLRVNLTGLVSS